MRELCDRDLLGDDSRDENSIEWLIAPAIWLAIIAIGFASTIAKDHPDQKVLAWVVAGIIYVASLGLAVLVTLKQGQAVARQAAQLVMLFLVILVGAGLPFLVAWRFGQEKLWSADSMATLARLLQVVFVSLACIVPGLLFFLFDRQRLSTLRDGFEQQIFLWGSITGSGPDSLAGWDHP